MRRDLEAVASERDSLRRDLEAVASERDSLRRDVEAVASKRDCLRRDLEAVASERDSLRRDCSRLLVLTPKFIARNRKEFSKGLEQAELKSSKENEKRLISDGLPITRFCLCCNKSTTMAVDFQSCYWSANGQLIPNWRERLVCQECKMNNRQRLIAKLVQQHLSKVNCSRIYLMEQVTPIFKWVTKTLFSDLEIIGSEYLGFEYKGGEVVDDIRHEDVMALSFDDASIDLVVSNDVLEHVPNTYSALRECARVLSASGVLLATIPFHISKNKSVNRAEIKNDEVNYLLPAQYHGNPLSADGSLVFHDFGWDFMDMFAEAGFNSAACEIYADDKFGHWGNWDSPGQIIFRATKYKKIKRRKN